MQNPSVDQTKEASRSKKATATIHENGTGSWFCFIQSEAKDECLLHRVVLLKHQY